MQSLGSLTDALSQRTILVQIVRDDSAGPSARALELQLEPRSGWGGPGTLGCHLLPV